MALVEVMDEDLSVDADSLVEGSPLAAFAKFVTTIGAPPFTFLAGACLIGYGVVSKRGPEVRQFSTSFLSPNFFERSQSFQHVSSGLQISDMAMLMGIIGGIFPLLALVLLKLTGVIQTFDLDSFRERVIGFVLACGCGVLLLPLLQALEAPQIFFVFIYAHLVSTLCLFVTTLYTMKFHWKTSVHSGGATCLCFVSLLVFPWTALIWAPLSVVLISWSRLYLRKHTMGQVLLGIALGFICYAAVFSIFDVSILEMLS